MKMHLFLLLAQKLTNIKQSIDKCFIFEVAIDPFYSESNMERLRRSIAQMEATGGTIHENEKIS